MAAIQREYKDRLFNFIFGSEENKAWTLSLYNAVNGTDYTDPDEVQINTIKEVLYLGMHNDTSFLLMDDMNLYEQQRKPGIHKQNKQDLKSRLNSGFSRFVRKKQVWTINKKTEPM